MKRFAIAIPLALTLIVTGCQSDSGNTINSASTTGGDKNGTAIDVTAAAGPLPVNLGSAGNFVILSKTGITNTGSHTTAITGNIGSSPITAAAMSNVFCSEMTGTVYGVDAGYVGSGDQTCFAGTPPAANKTFVDNAVLNMGFAYNDATARTNPTATELGAGNIGGMTLAPGLYKWSTGVLIPSNVTLSGSANDVWIFQIAGDLSIASGGSVPAGVKVLLSGGASAVNIFWQVGGGTGATLGTYSTFNGNILSAKQIIIQTGAVLNGRALAQTQVTLDAAVITIPVSSNTNLLGQIRGTKFEDFNGDGSFNGGDKALSGWTIYIDANNNGVFNGGEPSSVTGVSGLYSFSGLVAGTYHVREVPKAGWIVTYPSNGKRDISLMAGATSSQNNFGNFRLGSISGMKFNDLNGDRVKNRLERGLPGWTIVLSKVGGSPVSTTTDGNGNYSFVNLGPGQYNLSEVMQAGWKQTRYAGSVRIDSGTAARNKDFGNRRN